MTTDEKLAAILTAVQTDPGNRGLVRDPHDNLFTATKGDFEQACNNLVQSTSVWISTGFFIPSAQPPAYETDGPLGALFLLRALKEIRAHVSIRSEPVIRHSIDVAVANIDFGYAEADQPGHVIFIERGGPGIDGIRRTMRGIDITHQLDIRNDFIPGNCVTIGIGDGGNEIGMGKIPHETIVKNIPNGDLIHCRVPTDHLIVAGVSNWGAYALAAGIFVLKGIKPPPDLFDPDREKEILEVMVREGPLVDGVTGQQTATVDGLTWDEYVKPLIAIRNILEA